MVFTDTLDTWDFRFHFVITTLRFVVMIHDERRYLTATFELSYDWSVANIFGISSLDRGYELVIMTLIKCLFQKHLEKLRRVDECLGWYSIFFNQSWASYFFLLSIRNQSLCISQVDTLISFVYALNESKILSNWLKCEKKESPLVIKNGSNRLLNGLHHMERTAIHLKSNAVLCHSLVAY